MLRRNESEDAEYRPIGGRWNPIHPLLADVLAETFGIMVYQEDVSQAVRALAGFSHAEADRLRKILSKKDREYQLRDYRQRFFAGARARGVSESKISEVWDMMLSFSGYSFCKPHSASYARVSFQAAYLKTHHPAEFMAAVISNQGGFYSSFDYVSEARRLGLDVLPPDINDSEIRWIGHGDLLCSCGHVFRTNWQLLRNFHPVAVPCLTVEDCPVFGPCGTNEEPALADLLPCTSDTPDAWCIDFGLDAVTMTPRGEIWFSVERGVWDANLGWISDGDVLSDRGYVVRRNRQLVDVCDPLVFCANFGLDSLDRWFGPWLSNTERR